MKKEKSRTKHDNLGTFLQEARTRSNLSQWDVAKKLGYTSPQFISNLERGISSPPLKVLKVLVDMYGISSKELLDVITIEQERVMETCIRRIKKALA
ncbi:MAG: helix-turn-helix transcriptional regulator [Bdellovibrionia bacterium]